MREHQKVASPGRAESIERSRTPSVRVLDDVSDHMAQVLRHADELLAEWARFGASVRGQVERETVAMGDVVAGAIDASVKQAVAATEAGVDRAVTEAIANRIGAQLQNLALELGRLEARAKSANRALAEQRAADRRILWGIAGGLAIVIGLLVVLVLRKPPVPEPVPAPVPIAAPAEPPKPVDPVPAVDPGLDAVTGAGSATGSAAAEKPADPPHPANNEKGSAHGATHPAGQPAKKH